MARKSTTILVIDLEATCWKNSPPPGQTNEIIEIGICPINTKTLEIGDKESIIVKPYNSTVSPFCEELTTLSQADVDKGVSLREAFAILKNKYDSESCGWGSYGNYDRMMIRTECDSKNLRYPFGPSHTNIKHLFAASMGLDREVGMAQALELLGLKLHGTHHRGHDDAWNIAHIYKKVLDGARKHIETEEKSWHRD